MGGRFTKEYITLLANNINDVYTGKGQNKDPKKKEKKKEDPFARVLYDHINFSGEGKKTLTGKPEWCLVPMEAMNGVVRVFESGYMTYGGARTWLPGIKFSLLFSAMCRHLFGWFYRGHNEDEKSGEHPLCHVIANALMLLTFVDKPKFDDRPETHRRVPSREEIYAKMVDAASIGDGGENDNS
jgi:hypothetical protein